MRLNATVVQFGADNLSLARVVPAKQGRLIVTLRAVVLSVAPIPRCDANFLSSTALIVAGLTSATTRFYQHLQLRFDRSLAPVLFCPTLVVAGVRLNHRVDDEGAGAAGTLLWKLISLGSRLHSVVGKVPAIFIVVIIIIKKSSMRL